VGAAVDDGATCLEARLPHKPVLVLHTSGQGPRAPLGWVTRTAHPVPLLSRHGLVSHPHQHGPCGRALHMYVPSAPCRRGRAARPSGAV
jgi:hypothetical protein